MVFTNTYPEYEVDRMAVSPKMQPAYPKILGSMLGKLVLLSPEVANLLLVGPGSSIRHVQKLKRERETWPLPPTHVTIS